MKFRTMFRGVLGFSVASVLMMAGPSHAVDADAAQALAKKNDCFKCHAIDKEKKGPS